MLLLLRRFFSSYAPTPCCAQRLAGADMSLYHDTLKMARGEDVGRGRTFDRISSSGSEAVSTREARQRRSVCLRPASDQATARHCAGMLARTCAQSRADSHLSLTEAYSDSARGSDVRSRRPAPIFPGTPFHDTLTLDGCACVNTSDDLLDSHQRAANPIAMMAAQNGGRGGGGIESMGQLEKFPSSYSRHGSFLAMQVQECLASLLPLPMPAQEKRDSETSLSHANAESKPAESVTARGLRRPDALPRSCRPGASRQALAPGTRKVSLRRRNRPCAGCCRPGALQSRAEILESSSPPCASMRVMLVV